MKRKYSERVKRPDILYGKTMLAATACGNIYVTFNYDSNDNPLELFSSLGKAGICASSQCAAIGRVSSYFLQIGGNPEDLVKALKGVFCHLGERSCSNAIGEVIEKILKIKEEEMRSIISDAVPVLHTEEG